jgi:hypothetical protein
MPTRIVSHLRRARVTKAAVFFLFVAIPLACSKGDKPEWTPLAGGPHDGTIRPASALAAPVLPDSAPRSRFGRTVPADAETRLSVRILPDAQCAVHTAGRPETAKIASRLYADADGLVQFFSRPAAADTVTTLLLDCYVPGGATCAYAIDIEAKAGAPPPADQARDRVVGTLAPLEGDLRVLTSEEIARRGFPPRPDPDAAPEKYAQWREIVSRPWPMVSPRGVRHPGRVNGGTSSHSAAVNWAGAVATTGQVTLVQGNWNVPAVTYPYNTQPGVEAPNWKYEAYSSLWIGLDGNANNPDGSYDLIQCGTRQDVDANFSNYYAWGEYVSAPAVGNGQGEEQYGFTANANDQISANAWACDSVGNGNAHGGFGCFFMADWTQNLVFSSSAPIAPGATFSGNSAEWIMERPIVGATPCGNNFCGSGPFTDGLYALPNFGYVEITSPWANGPNTNGNTFGTADEIWMVTAPHSSTVLAQGFVIDNTASFQWLAYY